MANPNWFKGMESPNAKGRPSGSKEEETKTFLKQVYKDWATYPEHPLAFTVKTLLDGTHPIYEEEGITGKDKLNSVHKILDYIGKTVIDPNLQTQLVAALADKTDEEIEARISALEGDIKNE